MSQVGGKTQKSRADLPGDWTSKKAWRIRRKRSAARIEVRVSATSMGRGNIRLPKTERPGESLRRPSADGKNRKWKMHSRAASGSGPEFDREI